MRENEVYQIYNDSIMNTYTRSRVVFVKGKGSRLWDIHHKEYIDLFPGWGVSVLGHCPSEVMNAVRHQVGKLIHLSNNFYHIPQARLAKEIVYRMGFPAKVFFCNSGAESVEGALKLARAWGKEKGRYEIITMENSFHGRTLGSLTLTGQDVYQKGFDPLLPGVKRVKFNDISAVEEVISDKTAAVILELIQGEGGINVADKDYVKKLRALCDQKGVLLIVDEVQTGMGRTGAWFCFQNYGIIPDIITLAKGLGGGVPIGATVAKKEVADAFKPGMHASTFGGGPLVCRAGVAVFKAIQKHRLITRVKRLGEELGKRLNSWKDRWPERVIDVRGMGFMWGVELSLPCKEIVERAMDRGVLVNCTHQRVLRIMPAINVEEKYLEKGLSILEEVLDEAFSQP